MMRVRERLKPLPLCSQAWGVEEERKHLPYPSALWNLFNHQQEGHSGTWALWERRRWGSLEGVALSLHDALAHGSQSHLQIKRIYFVQLRAGRRFAVRLVSGLYILLLVKSPLKARCLGCSLSAGAAKHLLTVEPSADSKRPPLHWGFSHSHLSHKGF